MYWPDERLVNSQICWSAQAYRLEYGIQQFNAFGLACNQANMAFQVKMGVHNGTQIRNMTDLQQESALERKSF